MKTKKTVPASSPEAFAKWLRSAPKRASGSQVTLQIPVTLSEQQWILFASDSYRHERTVDETVQIAVDHYVSMCADELGLKGKARE
jgi:hypothetical protein